MAEKFDKVMQDGQVSFVPFNPKTRAFWAKHNSRIAGSGNAQRETVTIVSASEEEVKEFLSHNVTPVTSVQPTVAAEIEALKGQLNSQQGVIAKQEELINKLLSAIAPPADSENKQSDLQPVVVDKATTDNKNVNNGKGKQTESTPA